MHLLRSGQLPYDDFHAPVAGFRNTFRSWNQGDFIAVEMDIQVFVRNAGACQQPADRLGALL